MEKKICIIGGDLRNVYLAKLLAKEGWKVFCYGLEKYKFLEENIYQIERNEEILKNNKYFFSAIPFSTDGKYIKAPLGKENIEIKEILKMLDRGMFFSGVINKEELLKYAPNINFIDLMENEELTIKNAISTAEGAIQDILNNTNKTIYKSNVLILGFGRIGKIIANRLENFGCKIYCEARKESDLEWIKTYGYEEISIEKINNIDISKFDIIINTIPNRIIIKQQVENIRKECFVIDLASYPGGFDKEEIEKNKIKFLWSLGIPGKKFPETTAIFLKETLEKILKKER